MSKMDMAKLERHLGVSISLRELEEEKSMPNVQQVQVGVRIGIILGFPPNFPEDLAADEFKRHIGKNFLTWLETYQPGLLENKLKELNHADQASGIPATRIS